MNKKLIKLLACSACGLGIATSIPFMTTSCSENSDPDPFVEKDLPDSVYDHSGGDKTQLIGFTNEFLNNPNDYKKYNTIFIPKDVTWIGANAFATDFVTKIPSYIENLVFEEGTNNLSIGVRAFGFAPFKRIVCSRIDSLAGYAFTNCEECQSIKFKGDPAWLQPISIGSDDPFYAFKKDGTIYCQGAIPDPDHPEKPYGAELAKNILSQFSHNFENWNFKNW